MDEGRRTLMRTDAKELNELSGDVIALFSPSLIRHFC
jgi:hypothetical protein